MDPEPSSVNIDARLLELMRDTRFLVANGPTDRFAGGELCDEARQLFDVLGAVLGAPR